MVASALEIIRSHCILRPWPALPVVVVAIIAWPKPFAHPSTAAEVISIAQESCEDNCVAIRGEPQPVVTILDGDYPEVATDNVSSIYTNNLAWNRQVGLFLDFAGWIIDPMLDVASFCQA